MKKFYVSTPIYYPSGKLHLGHVYSTVSADVLKRVKEQQGYDSYFITGMDEHGEKIQTKAEEANLSPQEFVDQAEEGIKKLWKILDVDYDMFARTTDPYHIKRVQEIFSQLLNQGDIYLGSYEGKYCVSCETYVVESQVGENNTCPDCGSPLKQVTEETYKFKCSKYQDKLKTMIENDEIVIEPKIRKKEILNSFFATGIPDLSVTRTNFDWGIPVVENPKHVIYVWLDALTNYITFPEKAGLDIWPANVQIIGKEITRFHAIYWPMILLALGKEMPKKIFAHGWLLMDGEKMSKSKKNVIYPEFLVENYGSDAVRYFLLREIPFGRDGIFTPSTFIKRYNSDLVNELSNLVNRSIVMAQKYFDGTVTQNTNLMYPINLPKEYEELKVSRETFIDNLEFSKDLEAIWEYIHLTNKFIDETTPWILAKEGDNTRLEGCLFELLNAILLISELIYPYLPNTADKIKSMIVRENKTIKCVEKPEIIFDRVKEDEEIEKIMENMQ